MLELTIDKGELFDPNENKFYSHPSYRIRLEHSLISVSKWEQIWKIPFLPNPFTPEKTREQLKSYAECMIIGPKPPKQILEIFWAKYAKDIGDYISDPHSATTIQRRGRQNVNTTVITSEVIYYQMISLNIPVEFEKWHLNRLLKLIEVFAVKNSGKKMSAAEATAQRRALNAQRKGL